MMITEIQVHEILSREFPELKRLFFKNNKDTFKLMQSFSTLTECFLQSGNINKLKTCFRVAENFLRNGDNSVRLAVEQIYVYSVSALMEFCSPVQGLIRKILPLTLKKDCLKHISWLNAYKDAKEENCFFQDEIRNFNNELIEFEPYQPNKKINHEENIFPDQYFTIQHSCKIAGKNSNLSRR